MGTERDDGGSPSERCGIGQRQVDGDERVIGNVVRHRIVEIAHGQREVGSEFVAHQCRLIVQERSRQKMVLFLFQW